MRKSLRRGDRAVKWIETYCVVPSGLEKGQHVRLTSEQRASVRRIYDNPNGPQPEDIAAPLSAFLALLHLAGPEALQQEFRPDVRADIFTLWSAVGPDLRAVLKRDGAHVVCPELRTRYPVAA